MFQCTWKGKRLFNVVKSPHFKHLEELPTLQLSQENSWNGGCEYALYIQVVSVGVCMSMSKVIFAATRVYYTRKLQKLETRVLVCTNSSFYFYKVVIVLQQSQSSSIDISFLYWNVVDIQY